MSSKSTEKRILFCSCSYTELLEEDKRREISAILADSGYRVVHYKDLCDSVLKKEGLPEKEDLHNIDSIVACYPRAVRDLFAFRDLELPDSVKVHNVRELDCEKLRALYPPAENREATEVVERSSDTPAWFPVIDYSRCTGCRQCSSFCLFDVYSVDDGGVAVNKPSNCKNNCPACARICPVGAIIFPKSPEVPVNGAEITDEAALKEQIQRNRDTILGDDIAGALRNRRKKAAQKKLIKESARERALKERAGCAGKSGANLFRIKKKG